MTQVISRAQVVVLSYAALLLIAVLAWHTERLYVGGLAIVPLLFIAYHCARPVAFVTALVAGFLLAALDRDLLPGASRIVLPPVLDAVILSGTLCATVLIADRLQRARHEAERDSLTGIPNRAYFIRKLTERIASSHSRHAAVLFADLDGFKAINDSAGHVTGDAVLELAAERLQHALRSNDTIARIGGDEFAILVEDVDTEDRAREIVRHIERVIADPFRVGDHQFELGVTVGVSFYPNDGADAKSLLRVSDARMYSEKSVKIRHRTR
jgi:diguanylate cyclase (GGDEF)-like protein